LCFYVFIFNFRENLWAPFGFFSQAHKLGFVDVRMVSFLTIKKLYIIKAVSHNVTVDGQLESPGRHTDRPLVSSSSSMGEVPLSPVGRSPSHCRAMPRTPRGELTTGATFARHAELV